MPVTTPKQHDESSVVWSRTRKIGQPWSKWTAADRGKPVTPDVAKGQQMELEIER